jgi:hypothetical protein
MKILQKSWFFDFNQQTPTIRSSNNEGTEAVVFQSSSNGYSWACRDEFNQLIVKGHTFSLGEAKDLCEGVLEPSEFLKVA